MPGPTRLAAIPVVLVFVVGSWIASGITPHNELAKIMPETGELGRQIAFFENFSASKTMALEVEGEIPAARRFLDRAEVRLAAVGADLPEQEISIAAAADLVHDHLPVLTSHTILDRTGDDLGPEAIGTRLDRLVAMLRRPGNEIVSRAAYRDFLGLGGATMEEIRPETFYRGGRRLGPYQVHTDERHLLGIYDVAFPPNDNDRNAELMGLYDRLVEEAEERNLHLEMIAPYRHYRDNHRRIWRDLGLTLPVSLTLIIVLMFSLFRRPLPVLALHLPALGAIVVAGAVLAIVHDDVVPMMALGFAPAMIGVAIDYGIHTTRACQDGVFPAVRRPLVMGFLTSAAAFAVLLPGDVPILRSLGIFVIVGLGFALAVALTVLPLLLSRHRHRDHWAPISDHLRRFAEGPRTRNLAIAAAITLVTAPGLFLLRQTSDISNLDGSDPETLAVLEEFQERWGRLGGNDFLVAERASLDDALATTERVLERWDRPPGIIQNLLPSRERQVRRRQAWNEFWERHRDRFVASLNAAAEIRGLRARAFAPSLERYTPVEGSPDFITLEDWRECGADRLLGAVLTEKDDGWRVLTPVPMKGGRQEISARGEELDRVDGVWLASRRILAVSLIERIGSDLRFRMGFILLAMVAMLFVVIRRPRRVSAIAATPILALVWTYGTFGLLGIELTTLHVLVAAFIVGIGIDDAVFMSEPGIRRSSVSAVLMTTLSSISGLGAMCLAAHPLLASLGAAIASGMAACFVACMLTGPAIVDPARDLAGSPPPPA